jgi:hypothetical protein
MLLILVPRDMVADGAYAGHRHSTIEQTSLSVSLPQTDDSVNVEIATIFNAVENGVTKANIKLFSQHFAKQVSLNLNNQGNAYYSANQSYYILQNYFDTHKVRLFKFSKQNASDTSPYATGGGLLRGRPANDVFQIFISLTFEDNRWVISQFNMY